MNKTVDEIGFKHLDVVFTDEYFNIPYIIVTQEFECLEDTKDKNFVLDHAKSKIKLEGLATEFEILSMPIKDLLKLVNERAKQNRISKENLEAILVKELLSNRDEITEQTELIKEFEEVIEKSKKGDQDKLEECLNSEKELEESEGIDW